MSQISERQRMKGEVAKRVQSLCELRDTPDGKRELANLRRGVGHRPGEFPAIWGSFLQTMPEELMSRGGAPSRAEWAIYIAVTMYALHQQGNSEPMHCEKVGLGKAIAKLITTEDDLPRIVRRFEIMATASDMEALSYHLRSMIQLLRSKDIALDYVQLASDLYDYQNDDPAYADQIRLHWGEDFYRVYDKLGKVEEVS